MAGDIEQHHNRSLTQAIIVTSQTAQFLDHIKKSKQHQQGEQHESRCDQHLRGQIACKQFHARLQRGARSRVRR